MHKINRKINKLTYYWIYSGLLILMIMMLLFYFVHSKTHSNSFDEEQNWISYKFINNNLVMEFPYLIKKRCLIKEVRYGINNAKPNNILVMPMCKSEIKEIEKYRTIPPSTSKVSLYLIMIDGTKTKAREFYVNYK